MGNNPVKKRKNTKMKRGMRGVGYDGYENFTIGRFDKVNAILKGERLLQPLKILMIVLTFWNDHFTFVLLLSTTVSFHKIKCENIFYTIYNI